MRSRVSVPVKVVGRDHWGDLAALAISHEICGEKVVKKDNNFSFAGEHRVRLYRFTKNVHWRIPTEVELDITDVTPASPPPRRAQRR
jgi:hypothetical protein